MPKSIEEINEKIRKGKAVVVNAEEIIGLVEEKGLKRAAQEVDVVTTGTFGAMCSSGAFLNLGHSKPRTKIGGGKATLNDVPVYTGLAAVDVYLGATAIPEDDPRNKIFPGRFLYGGGHVLEDLVAGRDVRLVASTYGTDCYPRKELRTLINLRDINEAILCNPRNAYQNYNVAVNLSDKPIYTYMGVLGPNLGNANYSTASQISPLLNDPYYKTIGLGTRIFLGGGIGYVSWNGTQHNPTPPRSENGVTRAGAATLMVTGDLKQMSPRWVCGGSFLGYGCTLFIGLGVPIPILDEEICQYTAVRDEEIWAPVVDYSQSYPSRMPGNIAEVNYAQLKSGKIMVKGKEIPTFPLASYFRALEVANELKEWIRSGAFELTQPVQALPGANSGLTCKPMNERPIPEMPADNPIGFLAAD